MRYVTTIGEREYIIEVIDETRVTVNGKLLEVDFHSISGQPIYSLLVNGKSYEASVFPTEDYWQVLLQGRSYPVMVEDERERRLRAATTGGISQRGEFHLKAPMPGMVVAVQVADGQEVEKGDVLIILESMKMQNELKAPRAGRITRVRVSPGDSVEQRATLLTVI